jgi:hypothetical protein
MSPAFLSAVSTHGIVRTLLPELTFLPPTTPNPGPALPVNWGATLSSRTLSKESSTRSRASSSAIYSSHILVSLADEDNVVSGDLKCLRGEREGRLGFLRVWLLFELAREGSERELGRIVKDFMIFVEFRFDFLGLVGIDNEKSVVDVPVKGRFRLRDIPGIWTEGFASTARVVRLGSWSGKSGIGVGDFRWADESVVIGIVAAVISVVVDVAVPGGSLGEAGLEDQECLGNWEHWEVAKEVSDKWRRFPGSRIGITDEDGLIADNVEAPIWVEGWCIASRRLIARKIRNATCGIVLVIFIFHETHLSHQS